jgi:hypothetical protein
LPLAEYQRNNVLSLSDPSRLLARCKSKHLSSVKESSKEKPQRLTSDHSMRCTSCRGSELEQAKCMPNSIRKY